MTFNDHILLHIVECVRHSSLLWVYSAFCFESHLHVLKQNVLGPKQPEQQMAKKSLGILDYIFETSYSSSSMYVTGSPYGLTFCGKGIRIKIVNPTNNNQMIESKSFKKCIYKRCVYRSIQNTLSTKRNDTAFKLLSGEVIQIQDIV